jgi:hypothetical protein
MVTRDEQSADEESCAYEFQCCSGFGGLIVLISIELALLAFKLYDKPTQLFGVFGALDRQGLSQGVTQCLSAPSRYRDPKRHSWDHRLVV